MMRDWLVPPKIPVRGRYISLFFVTLATVLGQYLIFGRAAFWIGIFIGDAIGLLLIGGLMLLSQYDPRTRRPRKSIKIK